MNRSRRLVRVLTVVFAAGLVTGCAVPTRARRPAQRTKFVQKEAGPGAADRKRLEDNCVFGGPKRDKDWDHGKTQTIYRDGYVLEHSAVDKVPLWVCEHVTREELSGDLPRVNKFKPDPVLPEGERAELGDYRGSGYDRGHMAPAGNQTVDEPLKLETFFLSNMAPQTAALNRNIWAALEGEVRSWAEDDGEVWTITGPMFYDPSEEDASKADGSLSFFTIGSNEVGVPTHCYKIVVRKTDRGESRAVGFVMENQKKQFAKPFKFEKFIESIDVIEERTGLNFLPDLDARTEDQLETTKAKAADWRLGD